jgi:hypothetical protein
MHSAGPGAPLVLTPFEQILLVLTAYGIKPLYMLLAARCLVRHRNAAASEVRVAWRGLAVFLLGETACAANYLLLDGRYGLVQAVHDAGMIATFALLARAMTHGADLRVIAYSDPARACVMKRLCRRCIKTEPVRCMLRTGQVWLTAVAAVAAALPLTIPLRPVRYETTVLGRPVTLEHGWWEQWVQARAAPLAAVMLFSLAAAAARPGTRRGHRSALPLLCLAAGPAGFALLRTVVAFPFLSAIVWMGFWEEASELAMVLVVSRWMRGWNDRALRARRMAG